MQRLYSKLEKHLFEEDNKFYQFLNDKLIGVDSYEKKCEVIKNISAEYPHRRFEGLTIKAFAFLGMHREVEKCVNNAYADRLFKSCLAAHAYVAGGFFADENLALQTLSHFKDAIFRTLLGSAVHAIRWETKYAKEIRDNVIASNMHKLIAKADAIHWLMENNNSFAEAKEIVEVKLVLKNYANHTGFFHTHIGADKKAKLIAQNISHVANKTELLQTLNGVRKNLVAEVFERDKQLAKVIDSQITRLKR